MRQFLFPGSDEGRLRLLRGCFHEQELEPEPDTAPEPCRCGAARWAAEKEKGRPKPPLFLLARAFCGQAWWCSSSPTAAGSRALPGARHSDATKAAISTAPRAKT